ncbi:hypothetical protein XELAEV_18040410mg [Xenopus laevis]|uniref:Uncharacterized protein n=1 Tax=Xenopus laevis TaxID=8355 RepID=A0A974C9K5_XENLA|nr:hypothetical protein XELAEV_18040410mg [Xenopus laevis]
MEKGRNLGHQETLAPVRCQLYYLVKSPQHCLATSQLFQRRRRVAPTSMNKTEYLGKGNHGNRIYSTFTASCLWFIGSLTQTRHPSSS